jgi:hypothetical protein
MNTEIIVHAHEYDVERNSINIIIQKNLEGKIDAYIRKHTKPTSHIRLELTLKRENETQSQ